MSTIEVKIISQVSSAGTETRISYAEGNGLKSFDTSDAIFPVNNAGINTGKGTDAVKSFTPVALSVKDWYDQQTLGLNNQTIFWKSIAPKPATNVFVSDRQGYNDAIHIVVADDTGSVTGIRGNLLEKHIGLSKANDAISNVKAPQRIYYKDYLADFSENITLDITYLWHLTLSMELSPEQLDSQQLVETQVLSFLSALLMVSSHKMLKMLLLPLLEM